MPDLKDEDYRAFYFALRRLAAQPDLIGKLQSQETAAQASQELRISEEVRLEILNRWLDLEQVFRTAPPAGRAAENPSPAAAVPQGQQTAEINSARDFFEEAFSQLRRTYNTSTFMSVTMFIVGIVFLGIAAVGAVLRPENVAVSAVVGGIGIVQIVALFYRNPLADIARAVSNAQQAKIALTTYVIGISLIHDSIGMGLPNADHIKSLLMVTDKALKQMQTYIEEAPRGDSSSSSPEK